MLDLKGRTVVLTGASSGIGAAAALRFAARGANLVLAARRQDELEKVAAAVREKGVLAHAIACDVTSEEQSQRLVKETLARTGRLDVFVANAGVTMATAFAQAKTETLRRIMEVNFFGTVHGFKAALPHVVERQGQLAVVSSFIGKRGVPTRTGYAASKHALHGFCQALRCELLRAGVGVTVYCPGFVDTPIRENAVEADPKLDLYRPRGMTAERASEILVRAIERRKREVVAPFHLRLVLLLDLVLPSLVDRILASRLPVEKT